MNPGTFLRALVLLATLLPGAAQAANFYTRLAGGQNWNTVNLWSTAGGICSAGAVNGALPGAADTVTICTGHNVTLNVSPTILTINIIGTLSAGAQTLTLGGTGTLFTNSGTFNANTSTVAMTADAGVTMAAGTAVFNNLRLSPTLVATNRTYNTGVALTINGNFDINPTDSTGASNRLTVNMQANITVASTGTTTIRGSGTLPGLATLTTAGNDFASGKLVVGTTATDGTLNASGNSNITLNGTSGTLFTRVGVFTPSGTSTVLMQSDASVALTSGTIAFNDLTINPTITAARTYTFGAGAITVGGDFLVSPGKAAGPVAILEVDMGADITVTGSTTLTRTNANASGLLDATAGDFGMSAAQLIINAGGSYNARGSTITLNNNATVFTLNTGGTFTPGTSTVVVDRNAATTLTAGTAAAITLNNLSLTPTLTANRAYTFGAAPVTLNGNLLIEPIDNAGGGNTFTVNLGAALTVVGDTFIQRAGTSNPLSILNTTATDYPLSSGRITVAAGCTLTPNDSTVTLTGASGTLFTLLGTFAPAGAVQTVVLAATGPATFNSGVLALRNLSVNMPGQTVTMGNDVTVALALDFDFTNNGSADGYIATGTSSLIIASTGSISGAGAGGHVVGNLTRQFAATTTFLYTVGDGANYAPVNVQFLAAVTGNLTVSGSSPADHPQTVAGTSPVEPSRSVNRYWILKNSTIPGSQTATVTFNYLAGSPRDLDSGVTTGSFTLGRGGAGTCAGAGLARQCTTWARITPTSATPTQLVASVAIANGATQESDFVVGETRRASREKEFIYTRETY